MLEKVKARSPLGRDLKYQLNAGIPTTRSGISWHVSSDFDQFGFISSWNLRLETSVVNAPVDWDDSGTDITETAGTPQEDGTII